MSEEYEPRCVFCTFRTGGVGCVTREEAEPCDNRHAFDVSMETVDAVIWAVAEYRLGAITALDATAKFTEMLGGAADGAETKTKLQAEAKAYRTAAQMLRERGLRQ